ncbi:MAG TPA: heme exporter protein CcmD [Paracoccaceae bacterium]|nr:heme exporter protein CcmD [Paracoccaceae bacterium]
MPELGKYAFAVLAAYGVTGIALMGLVLVSLIQHHRVKRRLDSLEAMRGGRNA